MKNYMYSGKPSGVRVKSASQGECLRVFSLKSITPKFTRSENLKGMCVLGFIVANK